jgi:hypothetical protein
MQDEHAGDFTISPEASRYSHMQLRRHYVRKIVKAQSSLMTVDSLDDSYVIHASSVSFTCSCNSTNF